MYAVIQTGGKQYTVEPGDVIEIEKGVEKGPEPDDDALHFDRVLLVSDDEGTRVGAPLVDGAQVRGELLGETRGPKIKVFKMKRRKGYRRTRGHRQNLVRVRVDEISI